jgi:hypothetical protein
VTKWSAGGLTRPRGWVTALAGDALNEYIHHTGGAVFAVPPGLRPGRHYGDALFA